jgi:hypothetical protein
MNTLEFYTQVEVEFPGLAELLPKVAMEDGTVILTSVNEVWTRPDSLLDIFLGGFRIGEDTAHLVGHILIVTVDAAALRGCKAVHPHCYLVEVKSLDMNRAKTYGTPEYVEMMWLKLALHPAARPGARLQLPLHGTQMMWHATTLDHHL